MLPIYPRPTAGSPTEVPQLHKENYLSGFAELCQGVSSGLELQLRGPFQQGGVHTGNQPARAKCLDLESSV